MKFIRYICSDPACDYGINIRPQDDDPEAESRCGACTMILQRVGEVTD